MHLAVQVSKLKLNFFITTIYASNLFVERLVLWELLSRMATDINTPWIMIGDFNEILSNSTKWGSRSIDQNRVDKYQDYMNSCGMIDLGFIGPPFMWSKMSKDTSHLIKTRIDRA